MGDASVKSCTSSDISESRSISFKVKKMLSSPKNFPKSKGNRYFGLSLEIITTREGTDVPAIVMQMCHYLKTRGINQEGLFRVNGNMKVVERLKTAIEKEGDANLEDVFDVPAVASLLKMFLRELSVPVIPDDMLPILIKIQDQYGNDKEKALLKIKDLVKRLPKVHKNLLQFLCEFMLYISANSSKNKMTPLALAIVFGPNLVRCRDGIDGLREQAYVNAVLLFLLQEFEMIFYDTAETDSKNSLETCFDIKEIVNDNECPSCPKLISESKSNIIPNITGLQGRLSKKHSSNSIDKKRTVFQESKRLDVNCLHGLPSPLNKQLVDSTIDDTVKEHLFGNTHVDCSIDYERDADKLCQQAAEKTPLIENLSFKENTVESEYTFDLLARNSTLLVFNKDLSPCKANHQLLQDKGKEISERRNHSGLERKLPPLSSIQVKYVDKQSMLVPRGDHVKENSQFVDQYEKQSEGNTVENNDLALLEKVSDNQPTVPSLELCRIQHEDLDIQLSPRGRLGGQGNYDTPMRSPRSEPATPNKVNDYDRRYEFWQGKKQDTVPMLEMTPHDLRKRIISLKKIVSNFESSFEEHNGRKPKINEKSHIQKYIAELGRAKKQLKELLSDYKGNVDLLSETMYTQHDHITNPSLSNSFVTLNINSTASKEQTLSSILKKLQEHRLQFGSPEEVQAMSYDQLLHEKLSVQKALLHYESLHGRPNSKEDKSLMRPIYDRYRRIKRLIVSDVSHSPSEMIKKDLTKGGVYQPLSHHKLWDTSIDRDQPGFDLTSESFTAVKNDFNVTAHLNKTASFGSQLLDNQESHIAELVLHDSSLGELLVQQQDSRQAKKRLGKLLKEYEDNFLEKFGKKVSKDDRLPLEQEYREYKLIKSRLRLIEALVAKKQSNITI